MDDKNHGNESDSSSDDSDSSDNSDEAFNPKFDKVFFKTLSSLKRKDPKIYDQGTKFFDEQPVEEMANTSKKSDRALTIKKYEQDVIIKKGGIYDSDEEADLNNGRHSPTINEEQQMIKDELKKALASDSEDDDDDLLKKRVKTEKEEVWQYLT